jgi:hypothetical protein
MTWENMRCRVPSGLNNRKSREIKYCETCAEKMNKINGTMTGVAIIFVGLALSACSAIPTADDYARKRGYDVPAGANEVQTATNNSGLGTINADGESAVRCERRRGTGSNIGRSSCRKRDSGTQPMREATFSTPVPTTFPGMNRTSPE